MTKLFYYYPNDDTSKSKCLFYDPLLKYPLTDLIHDHLDVLNQKLPTKTIPIGDDKFGVRKIGEIILPVKLYVDIIQPKTETHTYIVNQLSLNHIYHHQKQIILDNYHQNGIPDKTTLVW